MIPFLNQRRESPNPIGYSQNEMVAKPANRIRKPAFTLIEIILVIGIIGVLVVIGVESFKKSREQLAFEGSVNRVVGLLQKARGLSINSALYAGYLAGSPSSEVVPSGYGVRITRPVSEGSNEEAKGYGGKIELFIDNRYTGQVGCDDLEKPAGYSGTPCFLDIDGTPGPDVSDIILETYDIPSNIAVQINAIYGITVIFVPPFADVIMYKDFDTTKADFSKQDTAGTPTSTYGLDQNTAMIFFTNRLNENTKRIIYFNRFGGVPELAKE